MSLQFPSAPKRSAESPAGGEPDKRAKQGDNNASPSTQSVFPGNSNKSLLSPQELTVRPAATIGNVSMATGISPYASTYHHHTTGNQPQRQRYARRCGLRIGDVPLEDAKLALPQDKSSQEQQAIRAKWQSELQHQESYPPALPPSQVPPLPPKEILDDYLEVPDGATEEEKVQVRARNMDIAAQSQKIDRERNNQAAKKSRVTRLEKLHNTRILLNEKAVECDWMRLKVIQLGGDVGEWDTVEDRVKQRMISKVQERVTASDQQTAEERKQEEQRKRAERTRTRGQGSIASGLPAGTPGDTSTLTPPVYGSTSFQSDLDFGSQLDGSTLVYPPQLWSEY